MWKLVLPCMLLGACALPDSTYTLDGVPVTLEHNKGPGKDHLALAVELYRREALEHWSLTKEEESGMWRLLGGIRWTDGPVIDGAHFDADMNVLSAHWLGCALRVPFYQALTDHYVDLLDDFATDGDAQWAEDLEDEYISVVCHGGGRSFDLPF